MPVKIKLPKRFYTPEQLAERWECKVEDISHLIETEVLEAVHKGAVRYGKKYIRLVPCGTEKEAVHILKNQNISTVQYLPVVHTLTGFHSDEALVKSEQDRMRERGEFDRVIMTIEVFRFEREHGEPTEETAPPSLWPWGDYDTPLLRILAEAVNHFCVNSTEGYPGKECGEVINWIKCRMLDNGMSPSNQLAGSIETLIAPRPYVHHRQRKHK